MEPINDNELYHQMILHWGQVEGQAGMLKFSQYKMAFEELQTLTNRIERTKAIVEGVIRQADQLGRSPAWIMEELFFEIQAERLGDRREWLRSEVAAEQASDMSLDLYSERLVRFASTPDGP